MSNQDKLSDAHFELILQEMLRRGFIKEYADGTFQVTELGCATGEQIETLLKMTDGEAQ